MTLFKTQASHGLHTGGLHAEFVPPPPHKSAAHLVHYADHQYFHQRRGTSLRCITSAEKTDREVGRINDDLLIITDAFFLM